MPGESNTLTRLRLIIHLPLAVDNPHNRSYSPTTWNPMQLNRFTDYGLRVLIYLCRQPADSRISLDFLSEHFNINKHHLQKISQRLSQLGWITSARGKNGGIGIKDESKALSLAVIVTELEQDLTPIDCDGVACPISGVCKLQKVLDQASKAFLSVLASYTLEDLEISDLALLRLIDK